MELISRAKRFVAMIDFHKRQNPTNIGQIELYLDDNPNKFNMLIDVLQLEEYHDLQPIDLEYLRMCLVDETLIQKLISDQNKKVQICQIEIEKKIDIIRQYLVDQLTTYYVNKKNELFGRAGGVERVIFIWPYKKYMCFDRFNFWSSFD